MRSKIRWCILLVFVIIWQLKPISYEEIKSQDSISKVENKILLSKQNAYLNKEFNDIRKIQEVSMKTQDSQSSESKDLEIKTKTRSGKNSIYVEALHSIVYQRRFPDRSKGFSFNLRDSATGQLIRLTYSLCE